MNPKRLLSFAFLFVAALAVSSIPWVNLVTAQQAGGGFGGAGTAGGGGYGGAGAAGGGGGGGGGGGFGIWSPGGDVAAYGEYVYVLKEKRLYQYAAYDLTLIKKIKLKESGTRNRAGRRAGGGGGGRGGDAGQGGAGGFGGGFGFVAGADGAAESVAAFGDFVYVLQGTTLHKLVADGLKTVQTLKLDADFNSED